MSLMDRIKAKAKADKKRIVLPEGAEERTVKAAAILLKEGICDVILLGDEEKIAAYGEDLTGATIINPGKCEHLQEDADTLYELRSMLATYPYSQTARLLLLQNLYLLHDSSFDEELRRAAVYITDRKMLFQLVEATHYQLQRGKTKAVPQAADKPTVKEGESRTISLIDNFLDSIPQEETDADNEPKPKKKRQPTPADAAIDYVAYLLECDDATPKEQKTPQLKGHNLIDSFIQSNDRGKIVLNETPEYLPQINDDNDQGALKEGDEGYFTETLARIYIKQGRYSKALKIIRQLSLNYPKKNAYFADQIRFLEKLIAIEKK